MRFKLTHRDLTMLTRYTIVGETFRASHKQCSIATGTEQGRIHRPLKPTKVTSFTMILHNSENNIRD